MIVMQFKELTDNDYIIKMEFDDSENGYLYCRDLFKTICNKYPSKRFVLLPTECQIKALDIKELKEINKEINKRIEELEIKSPESN